MWLVSTFENLIDCVTQILLESTIKIIEITIKHKIKQKLMSVTTNFCRVPYYVDHILKSAFGYKNTLFYYLI